MGRSFRTRGARALLALTLCSAAALGAAPQEDLRALVRTLRKERDAAPAELFARIASVGTEEALDALREAFGSLRREPALAAAAGAIPLLPREGELRRRGLAFLGGAAIGDARAEARRAAVAGLLAAATTDEELARTQFERILREAGDAAARNAAVDPLVASLGRRADAEAVGWIAGNASLVDEPRPLHLGVTSSERERLARLPFREVVREALSGVRAGDPLERLNAALVERSTPRPWRLYLVDLLAERPGESVAQALVEVLADPDVSLVLAALAALERRATDLPVAAAVAPLVRSRDPALRRAAVAALGRYRLADPAWPGELLGLAKARDAATRMGAAAALAHLRTPQALEALHALLADPEGAVRLEALVQVGGLRRGESIPHLLARFAAEQGRHRADVHGVLRLLTGLDLGSNPARWADWWAKEGARFELPTLAEANAAEERRRARPTEGTQTIAYHGLAVVSQRVAFVLDVSGSMRLPAVSYADRPNPDGTPPARMDVAREQLMEALRRYPDGELFNLIFFESRVSAFEPRLVRMTPAVRQRALRFVREQVPLGATALYPALELAFADPLLDTLYILSDGAPTEGAILDIAEIRAEVARWNGARRVRIHGIAMGEDSTLLRWLCADTGGTYLRIE